MRHGRNSLKTDYFDILLFSKYVWNGSVLSGPARIGVRLDGLLSETVCANDSYLDSLARRSRVVFHGEISIDAVFVRNRPAGTVG